MDDGSMVIARREVIRERDIYGVKVFGELLDDYLKVTYFGKLVSTD